ncbi:MAG: hypothetical protein VX777_07185 [Chlamydiota bacterium]|nr:hypothetical protein [Chlamydiota bacterium]
MSTQFNVCSYNMSSDERDYKLAIDHLYPKGINEDQIPLRYEVAQEEVDKRLREEADVFLLQEFQQNIFNDQGPPKYTVDRPLINSLMNKKFIFIQHHFNDSGDNILCTTDAAIALNSNRFQLIQNLSISDNCAIALTTDKVTQERILFVSAHFRGFDLTKSAIELTREYQRNGGPRSGDDEVETVLKKLLSHENQCNLQIIGADMNCNPERWYNRFYKFVDRGFTTHRTGNPTALNSKDKEFQEREIDFLFSKHIRRDQLSLEQRLFSSSITKYVVEKKILKEFEEWDIEKNPSDHKPICFTVIPKKSFFKRLF